MGLPAAILGDGLRVAGGRAGLRVNHGAESRWGRYQYSCWAAFTSG